MADMPRVADNPLDALTVDGLIAALRDLKKTDPKAGARPVYAGDTNVLPVKTVICSTTGSVLLSD